MYVCLFVRQVGGTIKAGGSYVMAATASGIATVSQTVSTVSSSSPVKQLQAIGESTSRVFREGMEAFWGTVTRNVVLTRKQSMRRGTVADLEGEGKNGEEKQEGKEGETPSDNEAPVKDVVLFAEPGVVVVADTQDEGTQHKNSDLPPPPPPVPLFPPGKLYHIVFQHGKYHLLRRDHAFFTSIDRSPRPQRHTHVHLLPITPRSLLFFFFFHLLLIIIIIHAWWSLPRHHQRHFPHTLSTRATPNISPACPISFRLCSSQWRAGQQSSGCCQCELAVYAC